MSPEGRSPPSSVDVSGEEIFELLQEHFEQGQNTPDQRRSERKPWSTGLTVWFEDPSGPVPSTREIMAATINVSRGGLNLLAKRSIHEGSRIRLRFNALPHSPTIAALARSCEQLGGVWHRVGVEFATPTESS